MKLRIKANSIRYRLSKTDVSRLADTGYLEEYTAFPGKQLTYALQKTDAEVLSASFLDDTITLFIPDTFVKEWPDNDVIGLDTRMPLPGNESLYLLIEKDFVCLDDTTEDQSDNYENPNKTC